MADGFCEFYLDLGVTDKEWLRSLIDHRVQKATPVFLLPKPDTFIDGCKVDFNVLSVALRFVFFDCITASSFQTADTLKSTQTGVAFSESRWKESCLSVGQFITEHTRKGKLEKH